MVVLQKFKKVCVLLVVLLTAPLAALGETPLSSLEPSFLAKIKASDKNWIHCAMIEQTIWSGSVKASVFIPTQESIATLRAKTKILRGAKLTRARLKLATLKANKKTYQAICTDYFRKRPPQSIATPTPAATATPTATPTSTPTATPHPLQAKGGMPTRADIQLLYERGGFGDVPQGAYLAAEEGGFEKLLDYFMRYTPEASMEASASEQLYNGNHVITADGINMWAHYIMTHTQNQFHEKLAFHMLHNLLATSVEAVTYMEGFMRDQLNLLRTHAIDGNYQALLREIVSDPAMLYWLNGNTNTKIEPNENFARELMELFSLGTVSLDGAPNYSELTVAQVARACTGWRVGPKVIDGTTVYTSYYDKTRHDDGTNKVIFEGVFDAKVDTCDDVIQFILYNHPEAPVYLATRLLKEYLTPNPSPELSRALGKVLKDSEYDLHTTLRVLFRSTTFYEPQYRNSLIKSPVERIVQYDRVTGLQLRPWVMRDAEVNAGMKIGSPPTVFGWSQSDWSNGLRIYEMYKVGLIFPLIAPEPSRSYNQLIGAPLAYRTLLPSLTASAEECLDYFIDRFGLQLSDAVHDKLLYYMTHTVDSNGVVKPATWNTNDERMMGSKVIGILELLYKTNDFQFK